MMAAFLLLIRSVELRTYLVAANPMLVRALSFVGEPALPAGGRHAGRGRHRHRAAGRPGRPPVGGRGAARS